MTTTTATRTAAIAPTEAEIRAALELRATRYPADDPRKGLRESIEDFARVLSGPAFDALEAVDPRDPEAPDQPDDLWRDLRPSEAKVLDAIAREGIESAYERAYAAILDELVAAGLRFAREHPDVPRAKVGQPGGAMTS